MRSKLQSVGAVLLGIAIPLLMAAVYNQFSPGGALSGTWNSQNVNLASGAFITGTLPASNGGTGQTAATDDATLIGNGTVFATSAVPSCSNDGGHALVYDTSTNSFACATLTGGAASSGTFDATVTTGMTTTPTSSWAWWKVGNMVMLQLTTGVGGTGNATTMSTASGALPAAIRPAATYTPSINVGVQDAGTQKAGCLSLAADGTIAWGVPNSGTGFTNCLLNNWTASGSRVLYNGTTSGVGPTVYMYPVP